MMKVGSIVVPVQKPIAQARKAEAAVAAPSDNPIYKVALGAGTPEKKRAAIRAYLAATDSKMENKARLTEWHALEAWLEDEFQRSEKEILRLTDTETFSVLQGIHQDMYGGLQEFDEAMKPLNDVLDAVYALNVADKTFDAYLEIKGDEAAQAERQAQRDAVAKKAQALSASMDALHHDMDALGEEKAFFGFGNVKKSARSALATKERELTDIAAQLESLKTEVEALDKAPERDSALGDLAVHKGELQKLLNISGADWRAQQQRLVDSALNFINNSKSKLTEVQGHLGRMTEQVDALYDTNNGMRQIYALVGDGVSDALAETRARRTALDQPRGDEDLTSKIIRNDGLAVLDEHAQGLDAAHNNCATGFAATTTQEVQLRTMRESNKEKMAKARVLATQGTSAMAGRLAMSVNAVSDAALGQSEMALQDTLNKMNDRTNVIIQKQVISQSLTPQQIARDLDKTVKELSGLRAVVQSSRGLMESGVAAVRESIEGLHDIATGLSADSSESRAAYSKTPEAR
jgi:hypothetical protein